MPRLSPKIYKSEINFIFSVYPNNSRPRALRCLWPVNMPNNSSTLRPFKSEDRFPNNSRARRFSGASSKSIGTERLPKSSRGLRTSRPNSGGEAASRTYLNMM
jgi:hypothetical protein